MQSHHLNIKYKQYNSFINIIIFINFFPIQKNSISHSHSMFKYLMTALLSILLKRLIIRYLNHKIKTLINLRSL